jgi:hypothetical protein
MGMGTCVALLLLGAAGQGCGVQRSGKATHDPPPSARTDDLSAVADPDACQQLAACCVAVRESSPMSAGNCNTGVQSGTLSLCETLLTEFHGVHLCP